jgi:hypothetical protein
MVALAVMLLPVATFFFAEFATRSLNTRYFFSAVLGLSLLFSIAVYRLPFVKPLSAFALIALTVFFYKDHSIRIDEVDSRLQILTETPKTLPILVSEASDYFELMESAPDPIRRRLVYPEMPQGFQHPDPEPAIIAKFWARYRPELVVVKAEEFFPRTNDFYVLVTGGSREGMTDWLIGHTSVKVVKRDSELLLLEVDSPVQ